MRDEASNVAQHSAIPPAGKEAPRITVVIPTYRREQVLVDTVSALLALERPADEVLVIDETEHHDPETLRYLKQAEANGRIRWRRHRQPGQVSKLNRGLREARGDVILFLDDDIVPSAALVEAHRQAYERHPGAWAVVGQVLQPGEEPTSSALRRKGGSALRRDLDFPFRSSEPARVENVITCNLSVRRDRALAVGGFDENFVPPVAHRAETEFAKRLVAAGGTIWFEPAASVRHLRAARGGVRIAGSHLASASPVHGVGDYYYALRTGTGWDRLRYIARRPFREIRTNFHLRHPWWIPVKFIGELRALALAIRLHRAGPKLAAANVRRRIVLLNTAAPDRPHGSMVRYGRMVREALECYGGGAFQVEALHLSPAQAWLDRFPARMREPIRYLCIAIRAHRLLPVQRNAVLHLLDGSHAYLLAGIRRLRDPLAVTVHDLIPARCLRGELAGPRPGRAAAWIIRRTLSGLARADAWVADSSSTRADLIRLVGAEARRVGVVHPAVIPRVATAGLIRTEPYVLHVAGNNNFYKNRPGVVVAFDVIRRSVPVKLKLVGPPPDADLRQAIARTGTPDAIEFHTDVSEAELASLFRGAALLLFPSTCEGFGWPPLEAMSNGCPVVCSDAGSLPEVVGDAALVAPPGDIPALAGHAIRILRDDGLRRRLVEAGLRQAQRFSLEAMARGLIAGYRDAETAFSGCAAHSKRVRT
jgi:glycosyltransferase involved in cell wall biosynthesis